MQQEKLRELLADMSLPEKIGQLVQLSGEFFQSKDISYGPIQKLGISQEAIDLTGSVLNVTGAHATKQLQEQQMAKQPHHIPVLFMADVIYGFKTIFPIPLGLGATWDPELVQQAFRIAGNEAAASGNQVSFAPMVDVTHDPRWGRTLESPGEDALLNARMATAMVTGFQTDLAEKAGQVSCVKHFAAYGGVEAGREYNSADMSLSNLYQNYLPPYKAAVDAGCEMVMTSLSTLNGVPGTADKWLLQDVLKKQWGFDGVLISDYASVYELVKHGYATDDRDSALKALDAGLDIDMKSPVYANELQGLVEDGSLSEDRIDQACWRVLQLKNKLGLFEDPYFGTSEEAEKKINLTADKRALARKVAAESLVLLQNKNDILPLTGAEKVALIGPYADEKSLIGMWAVHGDPADCVTIKEALQEELGERLTYTRGTDISRDKEKLRGLGFLTDEMITQVVSDDETEQKHHDEALKNAQAADVVIYAVGEHSFEAGEAGSKTNLHLPDNQVNLLNDLHGLGKKIVLVNISGRPLVLSNVTDKTDAIIQAWFPGTEGGHAIADVILGKVSPSGRLSMTFPYTEGQEPLYYAHLSTGRPQDGSQHVGRFVSRYIDAPTAPLYAFGYGLSYAQVEYGKIKLEKDKLSANDTLKVSIELTNASNWQQKETVQVYFHDDAASIVQPVKRLIDFKKVVLAPHSKQIVTFAIPAMYFSFYDNQGESILEPGTFHLFVGANSQDVASATFDILDK
ncbi:MAG TPA: beta-glucosidase BglX [Ligilactobacillus acidipiscis]|uniref:beta-glucosidase n=1 Tax=Ligilactobacillus acidipiscis TaxID=89059 RepID=A0A921FAI6_9LACO|nr:beta-glucosidase BglX [Ligilactobacillus acidipiscis]